MEANSTTVLGLDLGSNSIGWALVDEAGERILASGVRVFPEGVDRDTSGGELSKNENRRVARGMRRQIARRARRKRKLRELFTSLGWLPASEDSAAWETLDPFALRVKGLDHELSLNEFARALSHLNQRRGFLSNKKSDKAAKKEEQGMLLEISELAAAMKEGGYRTLGEYLHALKSESELVRIRGKHTRRSMLIEEFDLLWKKQAEFHPELTEELRKGKSGEKKDHGVEGLIFFQRKMYWRASTVGRCELEPKERRCPRADRMAQRFRLLQEVNNLRTFIGNDWVPLSPEQRTKLLVYLSTAKEKDFGAIRKHLKLLESVDFNLEQGGRTKLLGMPTDALLRGKNYFGKAWDEKGEGEKNEIVRFLLDPKQEEEQIRNEAIEKWGVSPEVAGNLAELNLEEGPGKGYAGLSRVAIEKLLPYLEAGAPLMKLETDGVKCALEGAGYLRPDQRVINQRDSLAAPPEIANPLVSQGLFELRKLINAINREYGRPGRIRIELAREVKGNAESRRRRSMEMRGREKERDRAAAAIREFGVSPSRDGIERLLLWEEQDKRCIYSGKSISMAQLMGGEVAVDHILPYPRSLDNSRMNKVVCFRDENDSKGDRTPREWLEHSNPKKYEAILQEAARLPIDVRNAKRPKFSQEGIELDDFINRQLVDTAYITTKAAEFLACLGIPIEPVKGGFTAELRHQWGMNSILRDDGLNLKNREDHRHHAVDALIIAVTDRSRLRQLAASRLNTIVLPPWEGFRHQSEESINTINVSHRVSRKVSGALHEETLYGPTQKRKPENPAEPRPWAKGWIEDEKATVYRKPLAALTLAMVDDIRDPQIRELVWERLKKFGVKPGEKGPIPKEAWIEPLYMTGKSGQRDKTSAVIKKVRLVKRDLTIQPLRGTASWVKPGSTHHIEIYEIQDKKGKTRREMLSVSMLEATNRIKNEQPLITRVHPDFPDAKFIMSMSRGEMVLAEYKGFEILLSYRTSASTQGQIYFVSHLDARPSAKVHKFATMANTLKGKKVTVDMLGRIRDAGD